MVLLANNMIAVEVAYALPHQQRIIALKVPKGCSAFAAVEQSKMTHYFPDIVLETATMGIFSQRISNPKQYQLRPGDRVEIYRPLIMDPKAMRKQRAAAAIARRNSGSNASKIKARDGNPLQKTPNAHP